MSNNHFIMDLLNVPEDMIQSITSIKQSDGSHLILITLLRDQNLTCPICGGKVVIHDYRTKILKHAVLLNRPCFIHFRHRRYRCKDCSNVFFEKNPFNSDSTRMTVDTKVNVLKYLKDYHHTYSDTSRLFNIPVQTVIRIFDRHVDIKRKTLPAVLSIDEKYFPASDQDSLYICVLMDFFSGVIIDVLPDRKKDYLIKYFSDIKNNDLRNNTKEMKNVKYVSIDMNDTYASIAATYFPKSTICIDSFHVLKHLTDAFTSVRVRCRRNTNDDIMEYLLFKFKYIFNHNVDLDNEAKFNKKLHRYINHRGIMEILFERFPDLKLAYDLKEDYIHFNSTATYDDASDKLAQLILRFADSNIPDYAEFYNMLINWRKEILNSFICYQGKRINNSTIESKNKMIETLFYNANGFVNFKRVRNRIMYCLNKKDTFKI